MNDWAIPQRGSGSYDLLLDLAGQRTRAGLEEALRAAVRDGRLAPGTRLPSSRVLAHDLGLARNTVADAYAQLVAEGWLTARQGSGTTVAARPALPVRRPARPAADRPRTEPADVVPDRTGLPYVLWPGSPDLSSFPRTAWLRAARRALTAAPNEAFGYTDPRGRPELRTALADYLARVRGVRTDPDHLVICTGYIQAVGLLSRVLYTRGARRAAVETVGLPDIPTVLRAAGLEPVPLPVDADGARVEDLGTGVPAVLLTPAHQFPLGVRLSPARRTAVVAWARSTGGIVVEDDYDGEFRYDRQPVAALQALAPDHVVYAGTASKSLAPGLRLAWIAVPLHLLDAVVREKRVADHQSAVIDQLTLAEFIRSGAYDRHVRRMRVRYRARRDRVVEVLAERAPGVRVSGIAAGLHLVLELPAGGAPLDAVVGRAHRLGLAVPGLPAFGSAASHPPALVVGYGTPPDHAFSAAVGLLCEALAARA
ncbi:MocR-like pyridoxine biosynthesis transcription factor PdxR [Streptomyces sp. NBC_01477]|uniref:MocR-like pyridoxine biosynthesis transcription factor PdxR n=1 Tax=Streptomyces sp. NBC_01477 TaxID=2976015 RepID=UPI002E3824A8|nr:PLP-dependent aminotransferase family protein [Streptomyces sp. NBC_01477]